MKIEFKNSKTNDYWIDVGNTSAVVIEDQNMFQAIKDVKRLRNIIFLCFSLFQFEELSSRENITIAINSLGYTINNTLPCLYGFSNYLLDINYVDSLIDFEIEKTYNYQI